MTIYTEQGFKSRRLTEHKGVDPFQWLIDYVANEVKRVASATPEEIEAVKSRYRTTSEQQGVELKYTDDDYRYLAGIKHSKEKQAYFISGYIRPNENGTIKRNNESLERRDLIIIDYDDLTLSYADFTQHVMDKLGAYNFIIYPSISYTHQHAKARLIVQPNRPLLSYEYEKALNDIGETIGLPYDYTSGTWSQCQGLPVITPRNKEVQLFYNKGELYPVARDIEPPRPKATTPRTTREQRGRINYDEATQIMREYIKVDANNLQDYTHAVSAICVLAKAVQDNEIDYITANECAKILAMGNSEWEQGNQDKLNVEIQNPNLTTAYTFKRKFQRLLLKADSMKELHKRLRERGEQWRIEHERINEKTGEVKPVPVPPRAVANILQQECTFKLIGEDDPELSPLAVYDLDSGTYNKGVRFISKLCLSVQDNLTKKACGDVIHFLTVEADEIEVTTDSRLLVFNNGIYNTETRELLPFSDKYVFINKIATNYNPNATEPQFDGWSFSEWLNDLANGDELKHKLLWQILANAIDANTVPEIAVFLFSEEGGTGKSTFQELLINLVGRRNTASLKIKEFEHDFKLAGAYGKSLIIGDDNNPKDFNTTSENFKSVTTGDTVLINPKGDKPFKTRIKALNVQSMNGIPRFSDTTHGMLRRLRVVEFSTTYEGSQKNRKVKEEYIKDPRLLEYIALKALEYIAQEFVETQESFYIVKGIEEENSPVLQFFNEVVTELESTKISSRFLFQYFLVWSREELNNVQKMSRNTFTKEAKRIAKRYGWSFASKNLTAGGDFKKRDFDKYDSMRKWDDAPLDYEEDRWKRQGGFYRNE